jgi:hypothetical protein
MSIEIAITIVLREYTTARNGGHSPDRIFVFSAEVVYSLRFTFTHHPGPFCPVRKKKH